MEKYNNKSLHGRNYSRRSYYEDMERETMGTLNPIRYQVKKQVMATVDKYGCVRLREDIHYYSVPHTLIGKKLKLIYNAEEVEIYNGYEQAGGRPERRHRALYP
jgi:hypothetical protein